MSSSLTLSSGDKFLGLLYNSFQSALPPATTAETAQSSLTLPSGTIQGSNTIAKHLSPSIYPDITYSEIEQAEINQWLTLSAQLSSSKSDHEENKALLKKLNDHLSNHTTILGSKPSIADAALFVHLSLIVSKWTPEERTGKEGYHNIVRYVDFVQNAPLFNLQVPDSDKVQIDLNQILYAHKPVDPKLEKERKKKEKAAAQSETTPKSKTEKAKEAVSDAAATVKDAIPLPVREKKEGKKEKKEKAPKPQKQNAPKELVLSPALIDLRVGHILKAVNHPNADSLYVSTIACGDEAGADNTSEHEGQVVRTVCSGLNGLVPLEEMQGRKVVVVCNLKPVTMRGVKSAAMVLACSPRGESDHGGPVELVSPPADAKAGERVGFEGWDGEPEKVLNPKKKVWETIQPGFTSTEELEVAFDVGAVEKLKDGQGERKQIARLVTAGGGACTVKSLKGGTVR